MRAALLVTVLALLCWAPTKSMGQEITFPPEVLQKQQHVPESVIYGILLHQAAAFKDKADALDLSGGDGSPYRHHMEVKFGLTPAELMYLNEVAIEYRENVQGPESDLKDSVSRFRAMHANFQRGQKVFPPPDEAKSLLAKRDAVTLRSRDEFHALIGDSEFARIDALVKSRIGSHLQVVNPPKAAKGGK